MKSDLVKTIRLSEESLKNNQLCSFVRENAQSTNAILFSLESFEDLSAEEAQKIVSEIHRLKNQDVTVKVYTSSSSIQKKLIFLGASYC